MKKDDISCTGDEEIEYGEEMEEASDDTAESEESQKLVLKNNANIVIPKSPLREPIAGLSASMVGMPQRGIDYIGSLTDSDAKKIEAGEDQGLINRFYANYVLTESDHYAGAFSRDGSKWSHNVPAGDRELFMGVQNPKNPSSLVIARQRAGLEGRFSVQLWRSGGVLICRRPMPDDVMVLDQMLHDARVSDAARSNGMIFSIEDLSRRQVVIDWIIERLLVVHSFPCRADDVRRYIDVLDYPDIVAVTARTMHPKGFNVNLYCVANPAVCSHEEVRSVSIPAIRYVDWSNLSKSQIAHMLAAGGVNVKARPSAEDIEKYRAEFELGKTDSILTLPGGTQLYLEVPSLATEKAEYDSWIADIEVVTAKAFAKTPTNQERLSFLRRAMLGTPLMQYAGYVKGYRVVVESDDTDDTYSDLHTDREEVRSLLKSFGMDPEIRATVLGAITKFITDRVIVSYGIPKEPCPTCHEKPDAEYHTHPELLALDMVALFFTLFRIYQVKMSAPERG